MIILEGSNQTEEEFKLLHDPVIKRYKDGTNKFKFSLMCKECHCWIGSQVALNFCLVSKKRKRRKRNEL